MKHYIIKLSQKIFIPTCAIMIFYCVFRESLIHLPYINILRYILLILGILLIVGGSKELLEISNKNKGKKISNGKNISEFIYFISEYIVNYSFCTYFFVYIVFELDKKSVLFNYLMLLIFGIYLGYRFAVKSCWRSYSN